MITLLFSEGQQYNMGTVLAPLFFVTGQDMATCKNNIQSPRRSHIIMLTIYSHIEIETCPSSYTIKYYRALCNSIKYICMGCRTLIHILFGAVHFKGIC